MQEFTISKTKDSDRKKGYYMYISFNEDPLSKGVMVTCSGAALIIPDGKTKYWFLYSFLHSKDWKRIVKIRIEQKEAKFSQVQLKDFGRQIAHLINFYISRSN